MTNRTKRSILILSATALVVLTVGGWRARGAGSALHVSTASPAPNDSIRRDAVRPQASARSLDVAGLREPVEVRRDRWGVPHIYAKSQHDLFFAQGFVAAQDRLFQMEMWRRTGEGRLAEVLGPAAVERDRSARLFKYRGDMTREWSAYAPDTKAIVRAFIGGVNAYIARSGDSLPPEFGLLGFRPEPWSIEVPLSRATSLSAVSNASSEVLRAQLVALLGTKKVEEILPSEPVRALDPAPMLDLTGIASASLGGFESAFADLAYNRIEGSNNWVVSGSKTATGKPILANDPHRVITNPAVRYITHLVAPGWNVIGAGEPASPGVAIGHNDRIAFGLTVVGMDQQDVYVESLGACGSATRRTTDAARAASAGGLPRRNGTHSAAVERNQSNATVIEIGHRTRPLPPAGESTPSTVETRHRSNAVSPFLPQQPDEALGCYRYKGAWRPIRTVVDSIRVKGEPTRVVRLNFTVHGPIVSADTARKRAFAVRSVHTEPGTAAYLASLSLGRARNWREFQSAMARWLMPSENMIYADVDGNIGWVAGGIMPRRAWSGMLPVPGDGSYEWNGFVPGSDLPRAFNPVEGYIATSNHNILPLGYRIPLSYEWASRYRIDRVREVLGDQRRFTIDDFKQLQHDDRSKLAEALVPRLVNAARRLGDAERAEVRLLASWNHHMSRDQVAPTVFAAWAPATYRRAIARTLTGQGEATALLAPGPEYEWLEKFLSRPNADSDAGPRSTDSLLLGALDDAIAELTRRFGADRAKWRWGDVHLAVFRHPLSSKYDLAPASRGGDGNTVYATGGRDYRQTSGASFREIIDLGDFDNSVVTNVPGQSADPRSPHYGDLLPLWAKEEYFPLVYSRARVERETEQVLWLRPGK